jgi:hypothetical protein
MLIYYHAVGYYDGFVTEQWLLNIDVAAKFFGRVMNENGYKFFKSGSIPNMDSTAE